MAHILSTGQGRPADPVVSGKYMGEAAESGAIYALHAAALLHLSGQGLPKNMSRGETYLRRAAKSGHMPLDSGAGQALRPAAQ